MNNFKFLKNLFCSKSVEVGSFWIYKSDLVENPFAKKEAIDVYKVIEKRKGLGTGKNSNFLKIKKDSPLGEQYGIVDIEEWLFLKVYVPYTYELIEEWGLK